MEVKETKNYDYVKSIERIDSYLSESVEYDESKAIPVRNSLTFNNGYYIDCYAIFVDIRESSNLTQKHQKKSLARIYRSYISEITAILQSCEECKEINIVGDCVSGILFDNGKQAAKNSIIAAAQINSIVNIINYKLTKKRLCEIKIGIGIAKGNALMIQAGYKGSGLNDVVWMGDVVNQASNLCNIANKGTTDVIVISKEVYDSLKGFKVGADSKIECQDCFSYNTSDTYTGNVINILMNGWLNSKM